MPICVRAAIVRRLLVAIVLALNACGLYVQTPPLEGPRPPPKLGPPEYHALWVDAFHEGIHTRDEIGRLVDTAHRANINAIFVQVRKNADAYYLDSLEPVATDIHPPSGFDPLRHLLNRAHSQNPRIEVHAWVNTFFVGTRSPLYVYFGSEWGNRTSSGRTGGYLDPGNKAVRDYTQVVLLHLAGRYDLDGLHLDFVRYPEGGDWGYSSAAVDAYNAGTGRSGTPDPNDPAWDQWRRDQVTTFVRNLYTELGHRKPRIKLSAALIPWGVGPAVDSDWQHTPAYEEVYQDWNAWLREGIIDLAMPMNYETAWNPRASRWFAQWIEWEKNNQFGRRIIIGVGAYFNYPEDTLTQIRQALAPSAKGEKAAGVAIYSYASTSLYGTSDYYRDGEASATLPRQPYAGGLDPVRLKARADEFNRAFWQLLTTQGSYIDPVVGVIPTQPAFTQQAAIPTLPWKR
jgi:uncharacterized lipoprotein YddW (UPF0748 family)